MQLPDTLQNCSSASQKAVLTGVTLTHKPAVVTFLHDIDNVTIPQFQLIIVLRSVAVEGLVANSKTRKMMHISHWISLTSLQKETSPLPF